ncbi:MAG: phosphoethanolamine transferase [Pseudomonadota bacterium]
MRADVRGFNAPALRAGWTWSTPTWRRIIGWRPALTSESTSLWAGLYVSLSANTAFWKAYLSLEGSGAGTLATAASLALALVAANVLIMLLLVWRATAKPVLVALLLLASAASYAMQAYGIVFDPDMVRNVLYTDRREAIELLSPALLGWVGLFGLLPALLVLRLRVIALPWRRALLRRAGWVAAASGMLALALALQFQSIASTMRLHPDLRHLVTPGNFIVSALRVALEDGSDGASPITVGGDATRLAPFARRPRLLVVVVGETVRASNWGLNGYARDTTPQLRRRNVVNFTDVTACGTSTEVSLPCMFSAAGRRDYDRARIRRSDSALHVLDRAGVDVLWRDNQSGCKGVCRELPYEAMPLAPSPAECRGPRCFDSVLLQGLDEAIDSRPGDFVLVLHPLGNHGPAYAARYPKAFERFRPACAHAQLDRCSRQSIVNAYDNGILYTDAWLARLIDRLAVRSSHDTALLYVSDHGESLGERGLYLHGMPLAIAPPEQTRVPMVLWMSPGMQRSLGVSDACIRGIQHAPLSHDHVFSTLLAVFDVQTVAHAPDYDLLSRCRPGRAVAP